MAWLALPIIFILPGFLTLVAWRSSKRLDFWEALFLVPFISILLSSWLGFILAEVGIFSLAALVTSLTVVCLSVAFVPRLLRSSRFRLDRQVSPNSLTLLQQTPSLRRRLLARLAPPHFNLLSLLFVAVLAMAGWAYARPAEVVSGTFDPGIYLSTGASIARTGSIAFNDNSLGGIGEELRPYLLERRGEIGVGAVRLPAFWMPRAEEDTVIPAFFHLYPVWLAILYSVGGLKAALFVSPVFGIMGVWAIFLLGRRLAGPGVGLMTAALLAFNPAQVWFARYPISETTIQLFLLGGLATWALMEEQRSRLLALVAGASFGLAHLAKLDQMFVPIALGLSVLLKWLFTGRLWGPPMQKRFLIVPYVLLVAHAIIHVYLFSFAYTWINLGPFLPMLVSPYALTLLAAAILVLVAGALFKERWVALVEWLISHRGGLTLALAGTVGLAALYGYFLWPLNPDPNASPFLSSDGVTPVYLKLYREEGLVRLGWYLSPLGLLLGLLGFVQFTGLRVGAKSWPLLVLFAAQMIFYLMTAGAAYPVHFWAVRRYVPLVIPGLLLFGSYALASLRPTPNRPDGDEPVARLHSEQGGPGLLKKGRFRLDRRAFPGPLSWFKSPRFRKEKLLWYLAPAALAVAMLAFSVQTSARFLWQTEYQDALPGLERWASQMEDPTVVLFKPRTEGNIFSAPLQYLFGKTAFVLQQEPDEGFYSQGVATWLNQGKNVYLVLKERYPSYLSGAIGYTLLDGSGLEIQAMEQTFDRLPARALPMSFPLRLYRLDRAAGYPLRFDLGPLRTENSLRLGLPQPATSNVQLSLRAWSGGPQAIPVSLSLDGRVQKSLIIESEPRVYQFTLPVEKTGNGYHEINMALDPASSAETGGIVLEWVEAQEAGGN